MKNISVLLAIICVFRLFLAEMYPKAAVSQNLLLNLRQTSLPKCPKILGTNRLNLSKLRAR